MPGGSAVSAVLFDFPLRPCLPDFGTRNLLVGLADVVAVVDAGQCVMIGPKQEMIEKLSRGVDVKTAAPNGVPA